MTEARVPAQRAARKQSRGRSTPQNSINAGLGGVGGGTGMVAIAHSVGVDTALGQTLLYAAPAVSVIAGSLLYNLKLQAEWYTERWQVGRARKTLEKQLKYPHTSTEHKTEIKALLEELDHAAANAELERIKLFSGNRR
ncbi:MULTISPECIES: hypothetical protein [Streptomyces]|uniref:Uncharacterized protein n=3 Tax=Streptomyces nigrescens TaxID=1920 RepID=A0ABY7J130_STRNI|nr:MULTISPECIES: hypothetical protein [Streptomyces]MCX5445240.1 hypothetical protein [Streptomyces libani]WAT96735.1 hypothetical protein STRLI_002594 [Streptomyces libani subsp. libani]WAU04645.1 hypothetical protein STRNI_002935 [Streptomyces nigrescens]WDT57519.1 hypothetical protein NUT86_27665 [Streptomyces sp. G7(2002)]GGV90111.1 hypothetical protein GCM10010500_16680 [Streptomyces libani subsp. libani]